MDIFAFIVLEETLDKLAKRQILSDRHSRLDQCITVIRACMDLIALNPANRDYTNKIRQALTELAGIARENGDLLIAARLKMIAHQFSPAGTVQRRTVQAASTL